MSIALLRRLSLALGLVILVWLGMALFRRTGVDTLGTFHLTAFDPAQVTAVVVAHPSDTVSIARGGSGWTVNGHPAAKGLVDQLLADLGDTATRGDLIAESPASHVRLGVDSLHARTVVVRAGGRSVAQYLVGHQGSDFGTVYLRLPGQDRVYAVTGALAEAVGRAPDDWRDKRILTLAADSITRVEVARGRAHFVAQRTGAGWTIDGAPADSAAIRQWLSQLANLSAVGFAAAGEVDSTSFAHPHRTVRIVTGAGGAATEVDLDSTATGFLLRRTGDSTVFRIPAVTADEVAPADSTLRHRTNSGASR